MKNRLKSALLIFGFFASFTANGGSSETSFNQPTVMIEEIELLYEKLRSKALTPKDFVEGVEILQTENIWKTEHLFYLKDLLEKELFHRDSTQHQEVLLQKYCKILFLSKEEFSDSFSQYFDRCPEDRLSVRSLHRQRDLKIEGLFFPWDKPLTGEFLRSPYLIQVADANLNLTTENKPLNFIQDFNSKKRHSEKEFSAFEKLVERINQPQPSFYERNKSLIWTALGVFVGATLIQQNYEIGFQR